MAQRFLAFLLFGVLALTALDGFEAQSEATAADSTVSAPDEVKLMHGGNGMPAPPK
jgi:hypothetical protein